MKHTREPIFSARDMERLERGLPRLSEWSNKVFVTFTVRKLLNPRVVWVNTRWFLQRGIDLQSADSRTRLAEWLCDEFGYIVANPLDAQGVMADETREACADRYGSSSGRSGHGGSGRVATYGCFQVKGVGPTPLVGGDQSPSHSHGCMSLAECIREAIYSEVAAAEFPHGAVPVIAILDTGTHFSNPDAGDRYSQHVFRGLVIRPAVLRAAHLARAPAFSQSAGGNINCQRDDAERTKDMARRWHAINGDNGRSRADPSGLGKFIEAVTEQIAFGQVHRLFTGGYFSSNVSLSGELLDFGNMHALSDWSKADILPHAAKFGDEMDALGSMIKSMNFFLSKYNGCPEPIDSTLMGYADFHYRNAWKHYCLSVFQGETLHEDTANALHDIFRAYYEMQQRHTETHEFRGPHEERSANASAGLYDAIVHGVVGADNSEAETILALDRVLSRRAGDRPRQDMRRQAWQSITGP